MLNKESLEKVKWLMVVASTIVMFLACARTSEQLKKPPEITPSEISTLPELKVPLDPDALAKTRELKQHLVMNGVPGKWFDEQLQEGTFQIYPTIDRYFKNSAEKQVDHDRKRDASWYFARLGVDAKIEKGKRFIEAHSDIFKKAEARHGIHQELVAAILGIETNFADHHERGKFYAFNSLVSQYIFTNRKKFAVDEITALYRFSRTTGRSPQYFTSSYAGAIGWGQFLPSSLLEFFIDANGVPRDTDPFSLEDTIFSVENYLYGHNLSGRNINDYDAKYKAVFAYNHSDVYVQAVLFIYDGLRGYFCHR
jgi:membrane-bound lytic murein transglycosylase B